MDDVDGQPLTPEDLRQRVHQDQIAAYTADALYAISGNTSIVNATTTLEDTPSAVVAKGGSLGHGTWGVPRLSGLYLGSVEVPAGFHPIRDPGSKWYVSAAELPDSEIPQRVRYAAGWGYVLSMDLVEAVVARVNGWQGAVASRGREESKYGSVGASNQRGVDVAGGRDGLIEKAAGQGHMDFTGLWESSADGSGGTASVSGMDASQQLEGSELDIQVPLWFEKLLWEDALVGLILKDVAIVENHVGFRAAWRSCSIDTAVRHLDIDSPRLLAGLKEQDASGLWDVKPVQCSSGDFVPGDYRGWQVWRSSLDKES